MASHPAKVSVVGGGAGTMSFLNRWIIGVSHALMSFWESLGGSAPPETPARDR